MIDSLSLDVLHEDLSHLTGESIYLAVKAKSSDLASVGYLLDILKCIHEWISSKSISSKSISSKSNLTATVSVSSSSSSASLSTDKLLNLNDVKQMENKIDPIASPIHQKQEEDLEKNLETSDRNVSFLLSIFLNI